MNAQGTTSIMTQVLMCGKTIPTGPKREIWTKLHVKICKICQENFNVLTFNNPLNGSLLNRKNNKIVNRDFNKNMEIDRFSRTVVDGKLVKAMD